MKLEWGEEKIKGFSDPVKKARRKIEYAWWIFWIITVVIIATIALRKVL